jgi:hypothetical protein
MFSFRKPTRPFKNLEDCRRSFGAWTYAAARKADPKAWPCVPCEGSGRVPDPNQPMGCCYDRTEYIRCRSCSGSGVGERLYFVNYYLNRIHEWQTKLGEWVRLKKAYLGIGLTKDQHEALKRFGVPHTYSRTMFRDNLKHNQ